jgi:hypothetical protein
MMIISGCELKNYHNPKAAPKPREATRRRVALFLRLLNGHRFARLGQDDLDLRVAGLDLPGEPGARILFAVAE